MARTGTGPAGRRPALLTVLRAPLAPRARREFLFCLVALPLAVMVPLAVFLLAITVSGLVYHQSDPTWWQVLASVAVAALTVVALVVSGAARSLGALYRALAASLLGERVPPPPPLPRGGGTRAWAAARLRDRPGWRAAAFLLLKLPVAIAGSYALSYWVAGLVNLTYPFWWLSFRNHAPGVRLSPVPVFTPFGWSRQGGFHVATFRGTFAVFGNGAGMLLAAPWLTSAVVSADRWLIQALLGPGALRQRLADLEQTRALAVNGSAALLRQVERNLHDGAQIRLATLAMNLGMAKEKLDGDGGQPDVAAVRELVGAAHQGAKEALRELRELARGIHPPVLDNGLADALASLAAASALPVRLTADIPQRPTPAIETIAYFCVAELLANAAKHSQAAMVTVEVTGQGPALTLRVSDDGRGGADPARGSGLAGLAGRVRTVDGRLDITSPPGGPTRVTVQLPLRA